MQIKYKQEEVEKFRQKNFGRISHFKDLIDRYVEYAPTIKDSRIKFGYPSLDSYLRITPTDNIMIVSKTSGKKTQFARNIVLNNEELLKEQLIIVFSLELLEEDEIERYLSPIMDLPSQDIEKKFAEGDKEFIKKAYEMSGKYDNVVTITDTVDIADIIPFVMYIEHLTEKRAGLIIVDYMQLIEDLEHRDEFRVIAAIAKKFKKINLALKRNIIQISQVGRESAKNKDGLDVNSAKGSGNLENSAQIVLALEMPDPLEIRKDKATGRDIYPFGELQKEIVDAINEDEFLEFHTLTIRKKKKYYLGVPKPTCIIQYDARNLRMTEYIPKRDLRSPITNEPF